MNEWFVRIGLAACVVGFGLSAAHPAKAVVIYDTTGGAENGGDPIAAAGPVLADRFVAPFTGYLTSVTLNLMHAFPPPTTGFTVNLYADDGAAGPAAATNIATVLENTLGSSFALYTYQPVNLITLVAGTAYFVGVTDAGGSEAVFGNTLDSAVLSRPAVMVGASYYNNGGLQDNAGGPYELIVTEVPEPLSMAVFGLPLLGLGLLRRRV